MPKNRLLHQGPDASYEALTAQLTEGQVLVATWLRDPIMTPNARTVESAGDCELICAKTTGGYYAQLRFFASTEPTENYSDYNPGEPSDIERLRGFVNRPELPVSASPRP